MSDSMRRTLDAALARGDVPLIHGVMYRNYQIGTLCDSRAWGPPMLFSAVTDKVTCPGCRAKLDGRPLVEPVPEHSRGLSWPTVETVDLMLRQVEKDRTVPYWQGDPHSETLVHVKVWLDSLRDWLSAGVRP